MGCLVAAGALLHHLVLHTPLQPSSGYPPGYTRNVESNHFESNSSINIHPKTRVWAKLKTSKTQHFSNQNRKSDVDSESVRNPLGGNRLVFPQYVVCLQSMGSMRGPSGVHRAPSGLHRGPILGPSGIHTGPIRGPSEYLLIRAFAFLYHS